MNAGWFSGSGAAMPLARFWEKQVATKQIPPVLKVSVVSVQVDGLTRELTIKEKEIFDGRLEAGSAPGEALKLFLVHTVLCRGKEYQLTGQEFIQYSCHLASMEENGTDDGIREALNLACSGLVIVEVKEVF